MSTSSVAAGTAPAPRSLPARFIGIITSPKDTFQSVAAHPRWLGAFILTVVLGAILIALPMTTPAGQEATLRQSVQQMESFGMTVTDQAYEQMRARMWFAPYQTAIGMLIGSPIITFIVAGLLFLAFNVAMGGNATFKQLLAVLVHSSFIMTLQQLFTSPLNYFRGSIESATTIGVLLPMLDPKSFIGRVAGMTDFFMFWYIVVLAMGLGVLYRRKTQPIAFTFVVIYAVFVCGIAAVMSRLGGA
jgi:hypothetical protein